MNYAIARTRKASQMVNTICALLFILFCSCYLVLFQRDYLSFAQHYYSHGRNVDHGYVIPVLLTFALSALGFFLQRIIHLPIRFRALHWFPSLFILSLFGSVKLDGFTNHISSSGIWPYLIAVPVFGFALYVAVYIQENRSENASFSQLCWSNLFMLFVGFSLVVAFSNTDEHFHQDLRIERALGEERYEDVLHQVEQCNRRSPFITTMCAYSLCQQGRLGEDFFYYADDNGSSSLLPLPIDSLRPWDISSLYKSCIGGVSSTDSNVRIYLDYLSRDSIANKQTFDFKLIAYLMDRDLDGFAKNLICYYPAKDTIHHVYCDADTIPLHFRQALCLYDLSSTNPFAHLNDSMMLADYLRFDSLYVHQEKDISQEELTEQYSRTYWYYYRKR